MSIHQGGRGPGHLARVSGLRNPLQIFGSNLRVWFDVQDLSTMWQDTAATTPAAVGSVVAKQFCKTNSSFYRQQTVSGEEPILRQASNGAYYLESDGSNDGMVTPSIDFTNTDKIAVFAAVRKASDAAGGLVVELSASSDINNGSFQLRAPRTAAANYMFSSKGTILREAIASSYTAPHTAVLVAEGDISGDSVVLRVNAASPVSTTTDQGTGNYGNYSLYYYRRGGVSIPFNGGDYGSFIVDSLPSVLAREQAAAYLNRIVGAY